MDMAIEEYRDARGIRRIVGSPADPIMRNILSARKVSLETKFLNFPLTQKSSTMHKKSPEYSFLLMPKQSSVACHTHYPKV